MIWLILALAACAMLAFPVLGLARLLAWGHSQAHDYER